MDSTGALRTDSNPTPDAIGSVAVTPSGTSGSRGRFHALGSRLGEGLILLRNSGTRKKSIATRRIEKARDPIMDLMSVLNEASVGGEDEEEVHMDDANAVFGHQQEEGEPAGEDPKS